MADGNQQNSATPWNIIGPLIGGVVLILVGVSSLLNWDIWEYFWEFLVIIIGIIIIVGAIVNARKK